MDKEDVGGVCVCVYNSKSIMEYCSATKKNEILPFAAMWMEVEGIMLSEIRERQISYDFTRKRTLRYETDEHKGRETKII